MNKKIGFIIQARTGSTRLPNKMLIPFYEDKTILTIILKRLKTSFQSIPIIVATTTEEKDSEIVKMVESENVVCFRGSENDVLQRFIDAADNSGLDAVVRICADNPFLSMKKIKELLEYSSKSDSDYISFTKRDGTPSIKTHYGFWAEYVTVSTLKRVAALTSEKLYHEHVTNYVYSNPKVFKIDFLPIDDYIEESQIRLTVDTQEDFFVAKEIYNQLMNNKFDVEPENIIPLVSDKFKDIMQIQIDKNSK